MCENCDLILKKQMLISEWMGRAEIQIHKQLNRDGEEEAKEANEFQ